MKLLHNKAGVTVLEGIIALGLLAVVTAGAFGVLASAARQSSQTDMREEMLLAVEKAKDLLQMYTGDGKDRVSQVYANGLCTGVQNPKDLTQSLNDSPPLAIGEHNIVCMLPPICDKTHQNSFFTYKVESNSNSITHYLTDSDFEVEDSTSNPVTMYSPQTRRITFEISCNGYEL